LARGTRRLRAVTRILLALLALAVILMLAAYLLGIITAGAAPATRPPAGAVPGQGTFGTTAQNNVAGFMASQGYRVDSVDNPQQGDGSFVTDTVVLLMPLQSPNFRLGQSIASMPDVQKQVSLGFTTCERFYPDVSHIGVGLEWGEYVVMFPAEAADIRSARDGTMSIEEFWARVDPRVSLIYADTGKPVYDRQFTQKDFAGAGDWGAALPPNAEPPARGEAQVRVQPSTAYLPTGSDVVLVATVLDSAGAAVSGQNVEFTYTAQDGEAQAIGSAATTADGAARISFTPPDGAQDTLLVGVSTTAGDVTAHAAAPVTLGPAMSGDAALGAITESLRIQGYNVMNARFEAQGSTGTRTSVLAEIASPRFDLRVRSQILSMAGTLFALYSSLQEAEPVLLYRGGGNSYQLVFRVNRPNWEAWLGGQTNENELWENIRLRKIIDAETGQPVDQQQFISKNFSDAIDTLGVATAHSVESTVITEAWGDQLNVGRLQVPVEAFASTFTVEERTQGAEFAIYSSSDPVTPIYSSTGDPGGNNLGDLRLSSGQYVLTLESGSPPAKVRLRYVERMIDSADAEE
jgi:hypothetical protein